MNQNAPIQFHSPSRSYSVQINHSDQHKVKKSNEDVDEKDKTTTTITTANTFTYTLRGLRPQQEMDHNDDSNNTNNTVDTSSSGCITELEQWITFCEHVFSYKQPNPPTKEYFLRHFINDPYKDLSHIRIATTPIAGCEGTDTNEIVVASCRIFHRYISFPNLPLNSPTITATTSRNNVTIAAGGIGEVCTIDTHRYRGLSKELLLDAINCMTQQSPYTVSFLHAASTFFPVYQKVGYHNIVSKWSVITIDHTTLLQCTTSMCASDEINAKDYTARIAQFPYDTDQLFLLHQIYTEKRYIGCIVRSIEYWNQYIASELQNTLYVIEKVVEISHDINNHNTSTTGATTKKKMIVGWMSLRYRAQQERYQLREFGCCVNRSMDEVQYIFQQLLLHCYQNAEEHKNTKIKSDMDDNNTPTWKLHLPTSVLREMTENNISNNNRFVLDTSIENDHGWMYKPLLRTNNDSDDTTDDRSWLEEVVKHEHLIWPSDSF